MLGIKWDIHWWGQVQGVVPVDSRPHHHPDGKGSAGPKPPAPHGPESLVSPQLARGIHLHRFLKHLTICDVVVPTSPTLKAVHLHSFRALFLDSR